MLVTIYSLTKKNRTTKGLYLKSIYCNHTKLQIKLIVIAILDILNFCDTFNSVISIDTDMNLKTQHSIIIYYVQLFYENTWSMHPTQPDLTNEEGGLLTTEDTFPKYKEPLDSLSPETVEKKLVNATKRLFSSIVM